MQKLSNVPETMSAFLESDPGRLLEPDESEDEKPPCCCDGSRLYWFDELPPILKFNPAVRGGYRAGMTHKQCLWSIFQYHNETGNILSHLLPIIALLGLLAVNILKPWAHAQLEFWQNLLPILICFTGSVLYHTFMARHQFYRFWIMLDVCGIFVLFLSGVHVVLWLGLKCYPGLRTSFAAAYYTTAVVAVAAALRATSATWRSLPMLALFGIRITLLAVRWNLQAGSPIALNHYLAMEVYALVGGVINAARIPERWFVPKARGRHGVFDYWLNSHQLMHILVALAMLHLHLGGTADYWYSTSPDFVCPAGGEGLVPFMVQ